MMVLCALVFMYLFKPLLSILLGKYLAVAFLVLKIILFPFLETTKLVSVVAAPFYILTNGAQVSQFAHTSGFLGLEEGRK